MNTDNIRIILASQSPRRRELLGGIGLAFEVIPSYDEEQPKETRPSRVVMELSLMKAGDVFQRRRDDPDSEKGLLVIGADTIVSLNGEILGKPKDEAEAYEMIRKLSGKDHEVFTGVTLYFYRPGMEEPRVKTFFEQTTVSFYPLTEEEIRFCVEKGEPMDKAGAYAIQGAAGRYISRIIGDINNVIGLPVPRLIQELKLLYNRPLA
ncbi:MAG: septum formation protein Maf [Lachnospiraceae bacterium]|nr:septum formation protein Maf [Lachnospiraceae bacterium]